MSGLVSQTRKCSSLVLLCPTCALVRFLMEEGGGGFPHGLGLYVHVHMSPLIVLSSQKPGHVTSLHGVQTMLRSLKHAYEQ